MNRIKTIRERLAVTQAELARGMGCTQGNVAHYEVRDQTVPPDSARRLIVYARSLGHTVTFEDIYGCTDSAATDTQAAWQGVA
jgi:putative transcriptional regulator